MIVYNWFIKTATWSNSLQLTRQSTEIHCFMQNLKKKNPENPITFSACALWKILLLQFSVILKSTLRISQKLFIYWRTCISTTVNSFLVFIFFLFRKRTVHSFHLADRCSSFSLGFCVKLIIKEDLINWIWLERAGFCWRLGSSIEVSWSGQNNSCWKCWMLNWESEQNDLVYVSALLSYTEVFEYPPLAKRRPKHFFLG